MKSIIQDNKDHCYLCGRNAHADYWGLDEHHVFGGSNRQISERYGLKVYLCHDKCHEFGKESVHKNAEISNQLKAKVQLIAMKHYEWTISDWLERFGKSYI